MKDKLISKFQLPCLLYDEACPLCLRFKQSLQRIELDIKLFYYPIQDKHLYAKFSQITESDTSKEIHLILSNSQVLRGSEVISYLAKQNQAVHKFSWLIESKMGQKAIDIFYKTSNKYRQTLRKCCQKCNH